MLRHTKRALPLLLAVAGALALPATAGADWLVTRDGARVETAGPWQVKGKLVVFKTATDDLASLRVAEVDLEESRAATEEAHAAAAAAKEAAKKPPAKRRPVRVLTDKDFPRAAATAAEGEQGEAAKPEGAPAEEPAAPLQIGSWERAEDSPDGHVAITGTLRNASAEVAAGSGLVVRLYDEQGELVASVEAQLTSTTLQPGESAGFRADFPGVFAFAAVKFETTALPLKKAPEPATPPTT